MMMGRVSFGGVIKEVCLAYVPEAQVDDYVIVHAGFALNRLDEAEANEVFEALAELEEVAEFEIAASA
jgi:hydrogenase expression/formation protein HypC